MQEIASTQSTGLKVIAYSLGSFTKGIGLRVIVGPPSMHWRNHSPVQDGWRYRLSWNRRDCRHSGYGRGTPLLRRRMSSRREVTPGAQESLGDRDAGIATWRTPIRRRRCRGSEQMSWVGSSNMGVAHNSERSVLGSMLVLGRTSGNRIGRRCRSPWKALEQCNEAGHSSGRAERYACVAAPQRFSLSIRGSPCLLEIHYRVILRPWVQCRRRSHIRSR